MKILRIQFKNLNSLLGDQTHEVDFEKDPLHGVSLFAITGPTGAGKSTLLDAITLALYGRAARYGDEPSPRDMMSRHCGECHASVDFEVASGRYRAEWHLRRARKKADGEFQKPQRYLYDAANVPLTQNTRDSDRLIEQIIGLDYGRFLRSVMLAQGEFTRFLKAGANERAELLECLTGTEIYSELGALAHAETSRRQTELLQREVALGAIALLTDEERRERVETLTLRQAKAARAQRERDDLLKRLERARNLADALEAERGWVRQQAELTLRREAAEPDMTRLRTHRKTLPFADALSRLDAASEQSRALHAKLAGMESEQARADGEHRRTLAAAVDFGTTLVASQQERLAVFRQRVKAQEDRRNVLTAWLEAHTHEGIELATALPGLIQSIQGLMHRRGEWQASQQRISKLTRELSSQTQAVGEARRALDGARVDLEARDAAKSSAEDGVRLLRSGGTVEARQAEMDVLENRLGAFRTLETQAGLRAKRAQMLTADRRQLAEEETASAFAAAAVAALEGKRQVAERQHRLQEDHLRQSRERQSFEEHRARLPHGEACPLCGATEHPWAHGDRPAVALMEIEAALAETVAGLAELDAGLRAARSAQTTAETRKSLLHKGIFHAESELGLAAGEIARLAAGLQLPDGTAEAIGAASVETATRQEHLRAELTRLQTAEKTLHDREVELLKATHATQTASTAETTAAARQQELQTNLESETNTLRRIEKELSTAAGTLRTQLAPFGHDTPEPDREADLIQALGTRQRFHREQEHAHGESERGLATARREAEACAEAVAELTRQVEELRAMASLLPLLPEDSYVQPTLGDWQVLDDAISTVRSHQTLVQLAEAAAIRQRQDAADGESQARALADTLTARLAASDFSTLADLRAARLDDEAATRIDVLERGLDRMANELQGKLATTRGRIEALRAGQTVEAAQDDIVTLESRSAAAEQRCRELLTDIGLRQGELGWDDENRRQHAAGVAELAVERERMIVWDRLQRLIGSHDGAKFRRYAQGISLDLLVRRANRHLARLNDRYELRRRAGEELDLDIVDHHQASVTRPLASLSGGESFLSSLALALGLADLAGRNVRIESLFIDEGFGTLDADSLDLAINALDNLRRDRKTVGVISHVELLKERIPTQIVVEKGAGGVSRLVLRS